MGMIVHVYRSPAIGDCTNGGMSAAWDVFTVVNCDGPFQPADDRPALIIVDRGGYKSLVPATKGTVDGEWFAIQYPESVGPMFGGNYAGTSDSRFIRAAGASILPIHDRYETPELARMLST